MGTIEYYSILPKIILKNLQLCFYTFDTIGKKIMSEISWN
jgi:hypothetical protein